MFAFRIILILLVFILLLALALMNWNEDAAVWLFGRTFEEVPVALIMLYSFAFGAVCVGIFTLVTEIQLRGRLRRAKRDTEALLEELHSFRNAPLGSDTDKTKEEEK